MGINANIANFVRLWKSILREKSQAYAVEMESGSVGQSRRLLWFSTSNIYISLWIKFLPKHSISKDFRGTVRIKIKVKYFKNMFKEVTNFTLH